MDDDLLENDEMLESMGLPKASTKPALLPKIGEVEEPQKNAPEAVAAPPAAAEDPPVVDAPAAAAPPTAIEPRAALVIEEAETGAQSYTAFREMLGLPATSVGAQPIPLPEVDPMDVMNAAMLMNEQKRLATAAPAAAPKASKKAAATASTTSPRRAAPPRAEVEEIDELDGLDSMTLEPGGSNLSTRSPQHHKVQLDNWADDADDVSDEEGEWVDVAGESTGASPTAAAPPVEDSTPAPAAAAPAAAPAAAATDAAPPSSPPLAAATADDDEAIQSFALDPEFDYDAPIENTEIFSVARALVEGEYYDREERTSAAEQQNEISQFTEVN